MKGFFGFCGWAALVIGTVFLLTSDIGSPETEHGMHLHVVGLLSLILSQVSGGPKR